MPKLTRVYINTENHDIVKIINIMVECTRVKSPAVSASSLIGPFLPLLSTRDVIPRATQDDETLKIQHDGYTTIILDQLTGKSCFGSLALLSLAILVGLLVTLVLREFSVVHAHRLNDKRATILVEVNHIPFVGCQLREQFLYVHNVKPNDQ